PERRGRGGDRGLAVGRGQDDGRQGLRGHHGAAAIGVRRGPELRRLRRSEGAGDVARLRAARAVPGVGAAHAAAVAGSARHASLVDGGAETPAASGGATAASGSRSKLTSCGLVPRRESRKAPVPIVVRQNTSSSPSRLKNSAAVRGKPGGVASTAPA